MADLTRTVNIIFGGKSEIGTVITGISREFNALNAVVEGITEPLANIGKGVLAVDSALAAMAVGGMALALKTSSDFNSSFGLISTSITATGGDLATFRDDVLNYANGSVKSISDINSALYTAVQAGVAYENSIEFIGAAEQLAVANKANLNTTVDLLTATMNAYGLKVEDVGHINDVYFTSTLIGKQTIDSLGQSMGQVVTIAANSGVSFEELSAAVATLTAKGMETSAAITAVRGVITTFTSPSKEASEAAAALGIDLSYAGLQSKGLAGALADVVEKTGGSTEKMIGLFTEMKAMSGVTGLAGDGMEFFNEALQKITDSGGSAEAAYQKMVATFENQTQILKNQATTLLIDLGTRLEPMAQEIGSGLSTLISGIKVSVDSGAFDPLFEFLDEVAGNIGTWIAEVGKAFPEAMENIDFTALITAFRDLGQALSEYFGDLDLTDVDDLSTALQTVVDVITGLVNITSGMTDAFRPFINSVVEFLSSVSQSGEESQKAMGMITGLSIAIQELGLGLAAACIFIDNYQVSISGLFNTIAGGTQILWNGFQILLEGLKGAAVLIAGFFVEFIDQLTFGYFPGLDAAKEKLTKWGEEIGPAFEQNGLDAAKGLDKLIEGVKQLSGQADTGKASTDNLSASLRNVPKETKPEIILKHEEATKKIGEFKTTLDAATGPKTVTVGVQADGSTIEKAFGMIIQKFPDGSTRIVQAETKTSDKNLTETQDKINKAVPDEKVMKIQAELDATKIKATAETIQTAIEWKAKFDIAEVEANAKKVEAAFSSLGTVFKSTGDTLSSMVGSLAQMNQSSQSWEIVKIIEDENRRRNEALELEKKLVNAQIREIDATIKARERGEAAITIKGENLQPHLEAFMFEILSAIQVRATAEGQKFLVGL